MLTLKKYAPFIIITVLLMIISILVTLLLVNHKRFETTNNNSNYGSVNEVKDGIVRIKTDDGSEVDVPDNGDFNDGDIVYVEDKKAQVVAKKDDIVTTTTKSVTTTTTTKKAVDPVTEDEVVRTFEATYNDLEANKTSSSFKEKAKNGFITITDFIFYGTSIKGYTFKGLTSSAKSKVIYLALKVDNLIDSVLPNYKETISSKYNDIKTKLISEYIDSVNGVCSLDSDKCQKVKTEFREIVTKVNVSWTKILGILKEKGLSAVDSIKNWYEIYSGKA